MPRRRPSEGFTFLRDARIRARYSQKDLAAAARCSLAHYCQIEAGYRGCSDALLYRLADVLDVDVIEFDKRRAAHPLPPRTGTPRPPRARTPRPPGEETGRGAA